MRQNSLQKRIGICIEKGTDPFHEPLIATYQHPSLVLNHVPDGLDDVAALQFQGASSPKGQSPPFTVFAQCGIKD